MRFSDIKTYREKTFIISTMRRTTYPELYEIKILPVKDDGISNDEIYYFLTLSHDEAYDKHRDIYNNIEKYVSDEAILEYFKNKEYLNAFETNRIYTVELNDYDNDITVGYFNNPDKANICCEYLNKAKPSDYEDCTWLVYCYDLDNTDYESLIKEFNENERIKCEEDILNNEREERELLARLKAKYEQ